MLSSPFLKKWFVFSSFQSIVSVYWGLISMEKTVDHCNISVDELHCKLVLVFHCKYGEERKSERDKNGKRVRIKERQKQKKTEGERKSKASKETMNDAEDVPT